MKEKVITFRVDEDLKNAFELVGKKRDLSCSQMLRAHMRETVENYMKNEAQGSLLNKEKQVNSKNARSKKSVIPDSWRAK